MTIYDFTLPNINNEDISLKTFKNKVILIVNVASKCGFAKQYGELQEIYSQFKDKEFVVLGFPCNQFLKQEYSDNQKIAEYCSIKWKVTFPIFAPVKVSGKNQTPLYTWLTEKKLRDNKYKDIKWNFEKFLIDKNGNIVNRFSPSTTPFEIIPDIIKLL